MCGRFIQFSDPEIYAEAFGVEAVCAHAPSYNVAPSQPVLAVRQGPGKPRELVHLRWGLIPSWSKGPDNRFSMINARSETVDQKPAYRAALRHRRCLVPTEGFYEWTAGANGKQPHLIAHPDRRPFAMAGLWETWQPPDGPPVESCAIIVTEANETLRPYHDRMPVILAAGDHAAWLDPELTDPRPLLPLLRPLAGAMLEVTPVSRRVNSPRNDDPSLIEPVPASLGPR